MGRTRIGDGRGAGYAVRTLSGKRGAVLRVVCCVLVIMVVGAVAWPGAAPAEDAPGTPVASPLASPGAPSGAPIEIVDGVITITGFGSLVTEPFELPAGRYRYTSSVRVTIGYDEFSAWITVNDDRHTLSFIEVYDESGTWTELGLLTKAVGGPAIVEVRSNSAWRIVLTPVD